MNDMSSEATRFRLHEHLFSQGSDYTIQDAMGQTAFHVGVRKFRLRANFEISDREGRVVAVIRQQLLSLQKHFVIESEGQVATLRREHLTQHKDSFLISFADGASLVGQGDFAQHEYRITRGTSIVAQVSASWFATNGTYGVDVAPAEHPALLLAVAIVIDDATAIPAALLTLAPLAS